MGGWFIWWEHRKLVHGELIQQSMRSALSIASLSTTIRILYRRPSEKETNGSDHQKGRF
jgi:hypothetical protein